MSAQLPISPITAEAIPTHWGRALVGELCNSIQPGFASGEHNSVGEGVPHIRPMNIDRKGRLDLSELRYVSSVEGDRRLRVGDVLFNNTNSPALIGKTCAILRESEFGFSNHMTRLRLKDGFIPTFVAAQLHYFWMTGFFRHRCVNHVNQASISTGPLSNSVELTVPPTGEQARIVAAIDSYFSRLDDASATLERVQHNLKRYRASVLKAAVEGRLVPTEAELARKEGRSYEPASELLKRILVERRRKWEEAELAKMIAKGKPPKDDRWKVKYVEPTPPETEGLPELPEGWCWASVDAVGDVLLGRQRAPQYLTGRFTQPYLRVANIKDDRIDFSDVETMDFDDEHFAKYRLRSGDILVSEGQSPELLGQSAIYRGEQESLCFQKTLHRFRPFDCGPSSEFAQLVFRSHVRNGVFMRLGSITTNIAHLTLEKFKASPFPLAPISEQRRIETETARLLSIADALETLGKSDSVRVTRLRQSILKWAFEGRLVDQDPSDEPASVLLDRIRSERLRENSRSKSSLRTQRRST